MCASSWNRVLSGVGFAGLMAMARWRANPREGPSVHKIEGDLSDAEAGEGLRSIPAGQLVRQQVRAVPRPASGSLAALGTYCGLTTDLRTRYRRAGEPTGVRRPLCARTIGAHDGAPGHNTDGSET